MWEALDSASGHFFGTVREAVESVCNVLANKKVAELERIATAVFIELNFSDLSGAAKMAKLSELKPHIDRDAASLAFKEAQPFLS
jgi:hypothetical protein